VLFVTNKINLEELFCSLLIFRSLPGLGISTFVNLKIFLLKLFETPCVLEIPVAQTLHYPVESCPIM